MSPRLLFLLVCLAMLVPAAGSASNTAGDPPTAGIRVYLPVATRGEVPLSRITGLATTIYDGRFPSYDNELYTIRADGSPPTRLTNNDRVDRSPAWSPDGALIAWTQTNTLGSPSFAEAWLMNSDGSNAHRIGDFASATAGPWSPAENRLLVVRYDVQKPEGQQAALYVTTPEAAAPTLVAGSITLRSVGWSPTGEQFWFVAAAPGHTMNLYKALADGSHITLVANLVTGMVSWSPDFAWAAYQTGSEENWDVYVSRADGSETRAVATSVFLEWLGPWVENGGGLFVVRSLSRGSELCAVDLYSIASGTTTPFVVSDWPGHAGLLGVSPDGLSVVYSEGIENYAVKLRKIGDPAATTISPLLLRLTGGTGFNFGGWSPDGRQVAFAHYLFVAPHTYHTRLFVANVEGSAPLYAELDDDEAGDPMWLPGTSWLSSNWPYRSPRLYNSRTGAQFDLPRATYDVPLQVLEWRIAQ